MCVMCEYEEVIHLHYSHGDSTVLQRKKVLPIKGKKERNSVGKKNKKYIWRKDRKKSTYINFTQNDINNASNDNDKVKNIPWVSKVTLERRKI